MSNVVYKNQELFFRDESYLISNVVYQYLGAGVNVLGCHSVR
jgi:hypothetical protein